MDIPELNLDLASDDLTLRGVALNASERNEGYWEAHRLGLARILLVPKSQNAAMGKPESSVAKLSIEGYSALLIGIMSAGFSGVLAVDLGYAVKRIFLRTGKIVFASSNAIDDRLGEVIYRAGLISLDQLTETTVAVNRTTKYGKVLLTSGIMSPLQLWEALKLQVREILASTFFLPEVYVHMQEGANYAPTEVSFSENSVELMQSSAAVGRVFRAFKDDLRPETPILKGPFFKRAPAADSGYFSGEMLSRAISAGSVGRFKEESKLANMHTELLLFRYVSQQYLILEEGPTLALGQTTSHVGLNQMLSVFESTLGRITGIFKETGLEFPAAELSAFLSAHESGDFSQIFLTEEGYLSPQAIRNLNVLSGNPSAIEKVITKLQSLLQFMLGMARDLLPSDRSSQLPKFVEFH